MNNNIERQRIVLAALLHDIGKFWQRADEKWDKSDNINKYYKLQNESYNITVPLYDKSTPKYVHALWTNAFFEYTKTGNKTKLNLLNDDTLANLSANHHQPRNHAEAIISIADRWSSGIDRPDEGEEGVSGYADVKNIFKEDFVRKVGLHSIFDSIDKRYKDIEINNTYAIQPLFLKDDILFPQKRNTETLKSEYINQWNEFIKEYKILLNKVQDFDAFYLSLLTLLKKYTWCIPSATNILPANVSLYEHLKSTAAIALSLYDYFSASHKEIAVNEYYKVDNNIEKDPLLMVCADVSGIQKFIYDIANKKAAASLKGRSFYIELLIQNIINEILNHEDIQSYKSNVIYSSGGKAYLILANTDKVKNALELLQEKISKALFAETDGRLFIALGYTSFRYESHWGYIKEYDRKGFLNKLNTDDKQVLERYETDENTFNLSMLWRSVSDKAAERKNSKFESVFINRYNDLFLEGEDFKKEQKKCSVLGIPIPIGKEKFLDGNKDLPVSQIVFSQVEIGKDLRNADFIEFDESAKYSTANLGEKFNLLNRSNQDFSTKIYLNSFPNFKNHKGGQGHLFYGGNYQPTIDNRPKTFEELCKTEDGKDAKLAVLRMDVDNLGQIFIDGLRSNMSFASYSTLSMMLDTFFAGYINTIQLSNEKYKEHIQILYSGGDDVFAIGRWDAIIYFAEEIRESFRKFVKRDDITISTGIVIVNPKYPISKAAVDAGEAENRAKSFIRENKTEEGKKKDAIDVFGETIGWGAEWNEVCALRKAFEYFEGDTGRSLLHNVQNYKVRKDENIRRESLKEEKDFSYIWNSGYQLSRLMDRLNNKKEAREFVEDIRDRIMHDKQFGAERFLDIAALAARLAEYSLKDKGSAN